MKKSLLMISGVMLAGMLHAQLHSSSKTTPLVNTENNPQNNSQNVESKPTETNSTKRNNEVIPVNTESVKKEETEIKPIINESGKNPK